MMHRKEMDNFMNKARHALNLPIRTRCAELTVLFDRGNILELQNFFPMLIDSIFGPQGTMSWGLRTICSATDDFNQLQHFLSPCGPLFRLIYNLLKDPSAKYDFPVAYLPIKVQQVLENSQAHPFYADLVHVNSQTRHVVSLLLNPFDYYIFHFAYHLINPWHQRSSSSSANFASWNTVYYCLCCDYMLHFLPSDPAKKVSPVIYYSGKGPSQPMPQDSRSPVASRLINSSLLNQSVEDYSKHHNFGKHPRNEIWRSETVLTVFIDMWLSNDQISQSRNEMNSSINSAHISRLPRYSELPTGEYMRIVRVLIKQLHAFSASAKIDDTYMCELKKITIPMVQGKFYIFLRNLIHRWPLDGSFRLVLELWLTYIQPWRYPPDSLLKNLNKEYNDMENPNSGTFPVDREYLLFIIENILVYIVIFQQLLPRFSRVDLVSPKMAVMLYRITKVFSQPNLVPLLKEVERSIENGNSAHHSPSHSVGTTSNHWMTNLPPLNLTTSWCTNVSLSGGHTYGLVGQDSPSSRRNMFTQTSNTSVTTSLMNNLLTDRKWSAIIKQKIYELEGPTFCYKPLFSDPPAQEVYELMLQIKRSIKLAHELVQDKQAEEDLRYPGIFGLIKFLFNTTPSNDEFSLNERLKVPAYLGASLQNLMEIFSITELQISEQHYDNTVSSQSDSSGPEVSHDYRFLTPQRVRERMKKLKYDGDPDLHPIRSTEVTFLVRMFYQFAILVNYQFGPYFNQIYYDPSFWGRLSRQFLQPPMTVYRYDKHQSDSPRVSSELPPRVSFRFFASYTFLVYFTLGAVIARLFFGYSFLTYVFILLFTCLVYKCVRAAFGRSSMGLDDETQRSPRVTFNFNDSF